MKKMNHIKSVLALILIFALTLSIPTLLNSCVQKKAEDLHKGGTVEETPTETKPQKIIYRLTLETTNYVRIQIKNYGTIVIELYPDLAPETVAWFQDRVTSEYYDDSKFHRVVKNSVMEGGIPKDTDKVSTLPTLAEETSSLALSRGVVSLVRDEAMNGKFFVCLSDTPEYSGTHVPFGKVVDGLDVLDKINGTALIGQTPVDKLEMMIVRFVYPDPVE